MSKDKKEIFGAMLAEYQKLQKLEKQYPTLAEAFAEAADAKLFGQIRATLDKKIADLLAAQAAKIATTTAAPEPSPDDEPNVDKKTFQNVLNDWASGQITKLPTSSAVIKTANIKDKLSGIKSSFLVVQELIAKMLEALAQDEMSIADIAAAVKKVINDYLPKDDKGFEELFKKDKKDYKAVSEALFVSGLAKLDLAAWLTEEVKKEAEEAKKEAEEAKEEAEKKAAAVDSLLGINNALLVILAQHKGTGIKINVSQVHKKWTALMEQHRLLKIYVELLDCLAKQPNMLDVSDFYVVVTDCLSVYTGESLLKNPNLDSSVALDNAFGERLAWEAIQETKPTDGFWVESYKKEIAAWLASVKSAAVVAEAESYEVQKLRDNVTTVFGGSFSGMQPCQFITNMFLQELDCIAQPKNKNINKAELVAVWNNTMLRLTVETFLSQTNTIADLKQKEDILKNCNNYMPSIEQIKWSFETAGKIKPNQVIVINNQSDIPKTAGYSLASSITISQKDDKSAHKIKISTQILFENMKFGMVKSQIQSDGKFLEYPKLLGATLKQGNLNISYAELKGMRLETNCSGCNLKLPSSIQDSSEHPISVILDIDLPGYTIIKKTEGKTNTFMLAGGKVLSATGGVMMAMIPATWGWYAIGAIATSGLGGFLESTASDNPKENEFTVPRMSISLNLPLVIAAHHGVDYLKIELHKGGDAHFIGANIPLDLDVSLGELSIKTK